MRLPRQAARRREGEMRCEPGPAGEDREVDPVPLERLAQPRILGADGLARRFVKASGVALSRVLPCRSSFLSDLERGAATGDRRRPGHEQRAGVIEQPHGVRAVERHRQHAAVPVNPHQRCLGCHCGVDRLREWTLRANRTMAVSEFGCAAPRARLRRSPAPRCARARMRRHRRAQIRTSIFPPALSRAGQRSFNSSQLPTLQSPPALSAEQSYRYRCAEQDLEQAQQAIHPPAVKAPLSARRLLSRSGIREARRRWREQRLIRPPAPLRLSRWSPPTIRPAPALNSSSGSAARSGG